MVPLGSGSETSKAGEGDAAGIQDKQGEGGGRLGQGGDAVERPAARVLRRRPGAREGARGLRRWPGALTAGGGVDIGSGRRSPVVGASSVEAERSAGRRTRGRRGVVGRGREPGRRPSRAETGEAAAAGKSAPSSSSPTCPPLPVPAGKN